MSRTQKYLLFLLPLTVYLLAGSRNVQIDSWYYAACVKHRFELINSHHLLYNGFSLMFCKLVQTLHPAYDTLRAMMLMNALAAAACLPLTYQTLVRFGTEHISALSLTLICAASFGFMRYACDAETYIIPLLFSLVSLYFFSRGGRMDFLLSSLAAALSVLFHQVHLWWTLAFALALLLQRPLKTGSLLAYTLPLLLIPVGYAIGWHYAGSESDFMEFVRGEYARGNAGLEFSLRSILLTAIGFFRSFLQVHGQIAYIVRQWPWTLLPALCALGLLVFYSLKTFTFSKAKRPADRVVRRGLQLAFALHLLFAMLSSGNAEFMVMLPFLGALLLGHMGIIPAGKRSMWIAAGMFVWNMLYGILPSALLDLNRMDAQARISTRHAEAALLWQQKPLVENMLTYQLGPGAVRNFLHPGRIDSTDILRLLQEETPVYTDLFHYIPEFSRRAMLSEKKSHPIPAGALLIPVDSSENLYGKNYIYRVISRK